MATYKVWLTVKDSYGNTKEVAGGTVELGLDQLSPEDLNGISQAALNNYVRKDELPVVDPNDLATDTEVSTAVRNAEHTTLKYAGFKDEVTEQ